MKILLVNDDGYLAEGIVTLESALEKTGKHEVWVCAPASQRSASSHAITIHQNIEITEVAPRHYKCSGFPSDCALFSLKGSIPIGKPDVLISGINHGFNVAADLIYSGTAGAAAEGALQGIPSIAISCASPVWDVFPFAEAAEFIARNLEDFVKAYTPGTFININVPEGAKGNWVVGVPGEIEYYNNCIDNVGNDAFRMTGCLSADIKGKATEETDFFIVKTMKKIAVSAVQVYPVTRNSAQKRLEELLKK